MKKFAIFRAGTHKAADGKERSYSTADLKRIKESYNPEIDKAPIVVGHPKTNSPAFGWIGGLELVGDVLYAEAEQLNPEFEELVKAGTYKNRSIALNKDGTLKHVGFLGGVAPAVKGLPEIAFSEDDQPEIIEFAAEPEASGNPEPAKAEPDKSAQFAQPGKTYTSEEYQVLQDALKDAMQENKYLKEELDRYRKSQLMNEAALYAEELVAGGKIIPAKKSEIIELYIKTSELAEAGGPEFSQQAENSPLKMLKAVLSGIKPSSLAAEFAVAQDNHEAPAQSTTAKLAAEISKNMESK